MAQNILLMRQWSSKAKDAKGSLLDSTNHINLFLLLLFFLFIHFSYIIVTLFLN